MKAAANGIEIEYDTFGSANDDAILLVMGLGAQMTLWDEQFCKILADHGHFVIRYDNRDIGLSTHFDQVGLPDMTKLIMAVAAGQPTNAPYSLVDMADDGMGLLDALSIESAHIVGASMGGMIAQSIAIHHSARTRSLCSVMSTVGGPDAVSASPEVMAGLMKPPATTREGQIEQGLEFSKVISSPGFPFNEQRTRERIARDYDRSFHPDGTVRQMAAIVAAPGRTADLGELTMPTLIIHGDADALVPHENGQQTAKAVPHAEFLTIEGMGHNFPPETFDPIATAIVANAAKVG